MEQNDIQIFLSYASQDQGKVLEVYDFLLANGFPNAWIDCKRLLPGQPWEFEILRNLRKSEIIVMFLSNTSVNKRGFIQKEIKTVLRYLDEKLNDDTYIIPVKIDSEVTIPEEISKIQYLDLNAANAHELLIQSLTAQTRKLGFETSQVARADTVHITKKSFKETWEGLPGYEVEYTVPMLHSTKFGNIGEVSKIVEASLIKRLHSYRQNKLEQLPDIYSWTQDMFLRINTFYAYFGSVFVKNCFLSIQYTVNWYGAGAAHPNYHFETFNFILNPLIEIDEIKDLFINPDECFQEFVAYVRSELLSIPMPADCKNEFVESDTLLDPEWINRGTSNWACLDSFTFSEKGLELFFAPYQVGAYACGAQFVTVPFEFVHKYLKEHIKHALSINLF